MYLILLVLITLLNRRPGLMKLKVSGDLLLEKFNLMENQFSFWERNLEIFL